MERGQLEGELERFSRKGSGRTMQARLHRQELERTIEQLAKEASSLRLGLRSVPL